MTAPTIQIKDFSEYRDALNYYCSKCQDCSTKVLDMCKGWSKVELLDTKGKKLFGIKVTTSHNK